MIEGHFSQRVLTIVGSIPRGKTLSYKEVARRAGRPHAYRAVGNILNRYDAKKFSAGGGSASGGKIPCHRVVRSDGGVGGYRWGEKKKRALLQKEKALANARRNIHQGTPAIPR